MSERKSHIIQKVSLGILATAALMIMYITYLIFVPTDVLKINKQPLSGPTDPVMAGEIIHIEIDYCKYRDLPSNIQIEFIGDVVVPSLSTIKNFPEGCHKRDLAVSLPASLPEGVYEVQFIIDYNINQLQEKEYRFKSGPILVLSPDNAGAQGPEGRIGPQGPEGRVGPQGPSPQ